MRIPTTLINKVTQSMNGLMSKEDKKKLDGLGSTATQSANGLMSKDDKKKLDNMLTIEYGSNTNGNYIKVSNGILVCYGVIEVSANESYNYVKFPYSFKDTTYKVSITNGYYYSINRVWSYSNQTKTQFQAWVSDVGGSSAVKPTNISEANWFAVGFWK